MILRLALAAREAGKPVSTLSLERRGSRWKLPENIRKVGPGARQPQSRETDKQTAGPPGGPYFFWPLPLCGSEEAKTSAVDLFKTPTSRVCTGIGSFQL